MFTIWKFPLKTTGTQEIKIPQEAELLTIQVQNDEPHLWALVDTANSIESRKIDIYNTGQVLHDVNRKYIGSYQLFKGCLMHHVFEIL